MSMVLAIANQKGGVGKTTTAINLSAALAIRYEQPTLLIDLDAQANATKSFIDINTVGRSIYDAMQGDSCTIADTIVKSAQEHLSVAPSKISLAKLEQNLAGELDGYHRLQDRLKPIRKEYKNIVIDCPPALGILTVNALVAATHLLVPVQSSYFALEGTDDLIETIKQVQARPNPKLKLLGILITMHEKRKTLARDTQKAIKKIFGEKVFKTVISKSVRLEESPAYRESIFTFAPSSKGASEYFRLCEEVMDRA
mgnify:FL=1|jgi:chromosome partitioning protein